jgi:RNA polymerase sigma-70 factor (ECF subfamily)
MSLQISSLNDEEILGLYKQSRDKKLLGELFKKHALMVFTVSMKYLKNEDDANDAVMNIFEKLIKDIHQHQPENFKAWLYTLTKNHCLMILRKPSKESTLDFKENTDGFMESDFFLHLSDEGKDKEEQLQILEKALPELKTQQRTCIELFYLKGKSYEEIAKQEKLSLNEVKSAIQNGKRNLKIILNKKGLYLIIIVSVWMSKFV